MPFVSQLLNINFGNGKLLFLKGLVFGKRGAVFGVKIVQFRKALRNLCG